MAVDPNAPPTQAGFISWVRSVMGVSSNELPDNSDSFTYAYEVALEVVNLTLQGMSPLIYRLAVYNLGGDNLINWTPNQPPPATPGYWSKLRDDFGCLKFQGGTVNSSSDESTSVGIATVEGLTELTLGQLQNLKTPYGRAYLNYASTWGTNWGIS